MNSVPFVEPWRVKAVEPIRLISRVDRRGALAAAGFNMFRLASEDVFVDLLTDSGTSAMSSAQWAGVMEGDEAYAGARNWFHFESAVREITGLEHVIPTHQGRGAETVYTRAFVEPGDVVPGNLHFDTTRAHIRNRRGRPVDVVVPEGLDPDDLSPFKGNVDLAAAERVIEQHPGKVKLFVLTVTSNTNGGQPVSLANARAVSELCRRHGIRLVIDAARFAENCYLIAEREPGQEGRGLPDIARDLFSLADGVAMSAKKDALGTSAASWPCATAPTTTPASRGPCCTRGSPRTAAWPAATSRRWPGACARDWTRPTRWPGSGRSGCCTACWPTRESRSCARPAATPW